MRLSQLIVKNGARALSLMACISTDLTILQNEAIEVVVPMTDYELEVYQNCKSDCSFEKRELDLKDLNSPDPVSLINH